MTAQPAQPAVPLAQFVSSASVAIQVASLLIRKPQLATAELTPAKWQAELDADQAKPTS